MRRRAANFLALSWPQQRRIIRIYFARACHPLLLVLYYPLGLVLSWLGIRFLVFAAPGRNFGHWALDPQVYARSLAIGTHPEYRVVLVAEPFKAANVGLLDHWGDRFTVVSNPLAAALVTPFKWLRCSRLYTYQLSLAIRSSSGETVTAGAALDEILGRYDVSHPGQPVMTLKPDYLERGREVLAGFGVPDDAWWACLHVREPGYSGSPEPGYRDADPLSYLEAARAIVERGGWVVRIGDPTMTPLPSTDRVVDYVHSEARADWMDIFLMGGCRFMIASPSGPMAVALLFGRPVAGANWIPMGHGPFGGDDIHIPKLYRSERDERILSFEEVLLTERRDWHDGRLYRDNGITWRDNTPEEIRNLTVEMMDRLDGRASYDTEDERLQSAYKALLLGSRTRYTWGTRSRVSKYFLRAHADLLET